MAIDASARELLAEACRIIAHAGLAEDVLGHVSMRTDAGLAIRCRGPQESGLLFTEPEDIHEVVAQRPLEGGYQAPNELPIHEQVLAARPDAKAVVHAHAPAVIAADLAGVDLLPAVGAYNIPAMRMAADGIPTYPRSLLINTTELGQEVAASLGAAPVLVLRGHGIVTVGATVEQAVVRALNIEILARMLVSASGLGTVSHQVTEADMAMMPDLGSTFNDGYVMNYHRARLRHAGLAVR